MRGTNYRSFRFTAASLALLVACSKPESPSASTSAGTGTASATSTSDTSVRVAPTAANVTTPQRVLIPPGRMNAPHTDSAAVLRYAATLDTVQEWAVESGDHHCGSTPDGPTCPLTMTPVSGAVLVSMHHFKDHGRIIAVLKNAGTQTETMFNLPQGETGLLHVQRTGGAYIARVISMRTGKVIPPSSETTLVRRGNGYSFVDCKHQSDEPPSRTLVAFSGCPNAPHSLTPGPLSGTHTKPAWISCAQGCCALEGP